MISLENRLQDTEVALYTALRTLHDLSGTPSMRLHADDISIASSRAQRSKADKQNDWKRQPLQTSEDLLAWYRDAHRHGANPQYASHDTASTMERSLETQLAAESSLTYPRPNPRGTSPSVHSQPSHFDTGAALGKLRDCRAPTAPNASRSAASSTTWLANYF